MAFENITDPIKERLSNPFLFSWFISWIIWNWRVIIVLFWFDRDTLIQLGHSDQISYIHSIYNTADFIGRPLLSAIVYTFGMPYLRASIKWWQTISIHWGEKKALKASEGAWVSFDKYLENRQQLDRIKTEMNGFYQKEQEALDGKNSKIDGLEIQLEELISKNNELAQQQAYLEKQVRIKEAEVGQFHQAFSFTKLDGVWKFEVENEKFGMKTIQLWNYQGGRIRRAELDMQNKEVGQINFIYWSPLPNHQVMMLIEIDDENYELKKIFTLGQIAIKFEVESTQDKLLAKNKNGQNVKLSKIRD